MTRIALRGIQAESPLLKDKDLILANGMDRTSMASCQSPSTVRNTDRTYILRCQSPSLVRHTDRTYILRCQSPSLVRNTDRTPILRGQSPSLVRPSDRAMLIGECPGWATHRGCRFFGFRSARRPRQDLFSVVRVRTVCVQNKYGRASSKCAMELKISDRWRYCQALEV